MKFQLTVVARFYAMKFFSLCTVNIIHLKEIMLVISGKGEQRQKLHNSTPQIQMHTNSLHKLLA